MHVFFAKKRLFVRDKEFISDIAIKLYFLAMQNNFVLRQKVF